METARSPFTLKIAFSGLCHYVPLGEEGGVDGFYRDGVYVMFPLADEHDAKIEFLEKSGDDYKVRADRPIRRGNVLLEVETTQEPQYGVRVRPSVKWSRDSSRPHEKIDVYGALPFRMIAPGLADQDAAILKESPATPGLRARLLLKEGELAPDLGPDETVALWRLPRPIGGTETLVAVGLGFLFTVEGVTTAKITVRTMFSTETVDFSRFESDGVVYARIANRCERDARGTIDEDFEHHYKMIRAATYNRYRDLRLDLPKPQLVEIIPKRIVERIQELAALSPRTEEQEMELRRLREELRSIVSGAGCNCLGAIGLARKLPEPDPEV